MNIATGVKLLILDDDEDVCETISGIASLAGYLVRWTTVSDDFFAILADWQPNLIIMDLAMPGMDGIETLRALVRQGISTKVIIVSGLGSRVIEAAGRAAHESGLNMAGVLAKPFSPARLRELLRSASTDCAAVQLPAGSASGPLEESISIDRLERALEQRQFLLHFQPKIDCNNRQVIGFEGLVRWPDPVLGLLPPDAFIPLAESSSLIGRLTAQIFELALDWFAACAWPSLMTLALNISARTLVDPGFPGWVEQQCRSRGISPNQLVLEVTETASMQNPLMTLELLTQFRIRGFRLSIDDFGVGYSSLIQLARLPFSEMKIDKSFVMVAKTEQEAQKIIIAIVGLAHALGLNVTAEGVEDEWAFEFLRDIGCNHAQGYLIARPMPADRIGSWLDDWQQQHREA